MAVDRTGDDPEAGDRGRLLVAARGPVLELTLSNPGVRNALSPAIYDDARKAFADARTDPSIRAVMLCGAGGTFCAGGNLVRLKANRERPRDLQRQSIDKLNEWITAIRQCPKPVVAAVEGAAAGAGFSLALACDLIVAAEDAKFVMAYARVGLSPDGGAIAALAAAMAPQAAFAACVLAEPTSAGSLYQAGVVHSVCEPQQVLTEARALCDRLARGPTAVYGRIKHLLAAAPRRSPADHLAAEREAFVESLFSADAQEGIDAFLDKRPAEFRGA